MKISATIIALNEERQLERCIRSLQEVVEEVILVDSGSQDRTCEVGEASGARVCRRPFTNFADQKNYATFQASHDWILSLDADECLSRELRARLLDLKQASVQVDAYAFPRRAHYLGRWIRHSGWYPDYKVRLFHKSKARWEGKFVHESVVVNGRVSRIEADLLHYTCDSIAEHLQRLDHYTTLAAQSMLEEGRDPSIRGLLGSSVSAFVKAYVLRAGFLDGRQGVIIAVLASYYNFLKQAKLWEMRRSAGGSSGRQT